MEALVCCVRVPCCGEQGGVWGEQGSLEKSRDLKARNLVGKVVAGDS